MHKRAFGCTSRRGRAAAGFPQVDIVEMPDRYVLRADLPGVDPADIDITLEHGVLQLSGRRPQPGPDASHRTLYTERVSGEFCRRIALPDITQLDGIDATSSFGTLEISLPKVPAARPRRVEVEVA